jgi:hypothetical protein
MEMQAMTISISASRNEKPELRIHGGKELRATAGHMSDVSWLALENELGDLVTIFLPLSLARDLGEAINTINNHHIRASLAPISETSR